MKRFIKSVYKTTQKGFHFICLIFSRGFYFYFYQLALLLKKIFKKSKFVDKLVSRYKMKQENPEYFLLLVFVFVLIISIFGYIYADTIDIVKIDGGGILEKDSDDKDTSDDNETYTPVTPDKQANNLYKTYGNMQLSQVDLNMIRQTNEHTVAWLTVDGTNINYPIVQTGDNDYYLNHSFDKKKKNSGWPFLDYRNNSAMTDSNTIFYGHNLLNKTGFGSVSNIFTKSWLESSNHLIIVLTDTTVYTYQIFSAYYSSPESYYLQTNFSTPESYQKFLEVLKGRSTVNFNVDVTSNDRIVTLSTCTEDNQGRKVVHAKIISEVAR